MQYRYEIEHAPANLAFAEGGAVLVIRKRLEAVWVYKWGTLSLASPCEGKDCIHRGGSRRCSIGMKSSTLPLTSP